MHHHNNILLTFSQAGADDITKSFATAENDKQANEVQNLVKLLAEAQQENRNKSEELRR